MEIVRRAHAFLFDKNYEGAFRIFSEVLADDPKNSWAATEMGRLYYGGLFVEQNYQKSFEYFLIGAQGDDPDAWEAVAEMLEKGIGTEKDAEQARKWRDKFEASMQEPDPDQVPDTLADSIRQKIAAKAQDE